MDYGQAEGVNCAEYIDFYVNLGCFMCYWHVSCVIWAYYSYSYVFWQIIVIHVLFGQIHVYLGIL